MADYCFFRVILFGYFNAILSNPAIHSNLPWQTGQFANFLRLIQNHFKPMVLIRNFQVIAIITVPICIIIAVNRKSYRTFYAGCPSSGTCRSRHTILRNFIASVLYFRFRICYFHILDLSFKTFRIASNSP